MKMPKFEQFPRPLRQAAVAAVGWRNYRRRYGAEYRAWTRMLAQTSAFDLVQIEQWQLARLKRLVASACSGTKHYAGLDLDRQALADAVDLRSALDLLPLLTKKQLRGNPKAFANRGVRASHETSTSGSTGAPMSIQHDTASIQRRFAFFHDHARMAGVGPFEPSVRFSGRILCAVGKEHAKPWLYNRSERQIFLSSYHLDRLHRDRIVSLFTRFQPVLLDGYPSAILEVLKLVENDSASLGALQAVITTAETLDPAMREAIRSRAGVPVMDYYSASEGLPFIQQCREGTYHVRWQSGVLEVDDGECIGFEGDGELVCTSFVQERTPLIRYRTGDLVQGLQPRLHQCRCGMATPTVESVLGRVEDRIFTPDGRAIGMFTYRTLKYVQGIGETQVIQHGFSTFEVRSVLKDAASAATIELEIKAAFERALGYPITLNFVSLESIPRGANGKVRLVISHVERG